MILEKTKIKYHSEDYDGVYVTLEKGEETNNTDAGVPMLFADYQLWLDIVGEETLKSDKEDLPQDYEGEKVDGEVYYYDLAVMFYCKGDTPDDEFKKWVLDCID